MAIISSQKADKEARDQLRNKARLSQAEMGKLFGVHEKTIGKWVRKGIIPCLMVNGRRYVTRELWDYFISQSVQGQGFEEEGNKD